MVDERVAAVVAAVAALGEVEAELLSSGGVVERSTASSRRGRFSTGS